jgi:hypothetical protein
MITTSLYCLLDPETGEIRYVGKTDEPKARLAAHIRHSKHNRRGNWIKNLRNRGLVPAMEVLFEVPREEWEKYERSYIRIFSEAGCDLINGTEGGESGPSNRGSKHPNFGKGLSEETKSRIGAANRGKIRGLDALKNQSLAHVGKPSAFRGRKHSAESNEKNRRAHLGKVATLETRSKMSAARRGSNHPLFGVSPSAEVREKIRRSLLARKTLFQETQ